jgi:LPXTG-motif cell wall-anchored protein
MIDLPDTGGPSLLLAVGTLAIGVGVLLYAVLRRRM